MKKIGKLICYVILGAVIGVCLSLGPSFVKQGLPMYISLVEQKTAKQMDIFANNHYFSELSDKQKQAYICVYNGILDFEKEIAVPVINFDDFNKVFEAITYDCPELFYVDSEASVKSNLTHCIYIPNYLCSRDEYGEMLQKLDSTVQEIISAIPPGSDEYTKEKTVHDAIIKRCEYIECEWDSTAYGAIVGNKAVCSGYARGAKYIFDKIGVKSYLVTGTAGQNGKSEKHMWNTVYIDGEPYYLDITWDDGDYAFGEAGYAYFNVTSDSIKTTHKPDYPDGSKCAATQNNYYIRENLYFTEADSDFLQRVYDSFFAKICENENSVSFAFSSKDALEDAKRKLIKEQEIFRILHRISKNTDIRFDKNNIEYSINENMNILRLNLKDKQ